MKSVSNSLQEWLIAIGLFLIIPTCVYLGCSLLSPKIDDAYWQEHSAFLADYHMKGKEEYRQREEEWKETDTFIEYAKKLCSKETVNLVIGGPLTCVLFYLGSVFVMPIIGASLLATGISLTGMYWASTHFGQEIDCTLFYGIGLQWFELLFLFVSLLIVLWYAYQCSEKDIVAIKGK